MTNGMHFSSGMCETLLQVAICTHSQLIYISVKQATSMLPDSLVQHLSALSVDYPVVNQPPSMTITHLHWTSRYQLVTNWQWTGWSIGFNLFLMDWPVSM